MKRNALFAAVVTALAMAAPATVSAQVTTSSITATVRDASGAPRPGARVVAIHEPSGFRYEARSREDGRVTLPGMRIGGPYRVVVTSIGYNRVEQGDVFLTLGVPTDVRFTLREAAVQLAGVTVTAENETVFSAARTGAATSVRREVIERLPSLTRRIEDFARLTPQYGGGNSFAGQDPRLNNITVDGSYFNNEFGLAGQPGDRTNVAPISIDAIEQVQIAIAPYDVRQGNFVGAGVNTVTRSGTNQFRGSWYRQWRNDGLIGKKAGDLPFNPGSLDFKNSGGYASGPIIPNRLFFFFNYEDERTARPGTTFRANTGSETVVGNVTRVLASDLTTLSNYLKTNFDYETGPWQDYSFLVPAQRLLAKLDLNINTRNKFSIRYNRLDSFSDILVSNSSSLGGSTSNITGRRSGTDALNFRNSNYTLLENIRSTVGELNSVLGNRMANNLLVGYTKHDESRGNALAPLFPFVDIKKDGIVYTSFGFEPFTPNNELYYSTFQIQDNFTHFGDRHTLTFGVSGEWYKSTNVFFSGKQSVYVYNSLADFYTDANGYLANPNRIVSPVKLALFQVRYINVPGAEKPVQPLKVFYHGVYGQDEWQPTDRLRLTGGIRVDRALFTNTTYPNANADLASFRDENGRIAKYGSGRLPDPHLLFSPRLGFNWDARGDRSTQLRGGTGVFTGKPAYVWISNQIGQTGLLTGFESFTNTTERPFNPDPNRYKPTTPPTGQPAASYELNVTDPGFRFPQVWRTDLAVDQRLPWGFTGTMEFLYGRDVNQVYYINANLPKAQSKFTGADQRPRWVGPSCSAATAGPCVTRINNATGNRITSAIVLKNQNDGYSWNIAGSLEKSFRSGLFTKAAYSYGIAKNPVDPGSVAFGSWNNNQHAGDPNNPGVGYATTSPGHRFFLATSLRREYFHFGATTFGFFWESRTLGNFSYTFASDANGDGGSTNDLLYIPRDASEMNFQAYTQVASGAIPARTFTSAEQATAWEAFIQQDDYLKSHRGKYAQRNAVFLPLVHRADLSITQELFSNVIGQRNGLSLNATILNVGNLLNKNWGLGQRLVSATPLIVPSADANGALQYRLRNVIEEGEFRLMHKSLEQTAGTSDVYRVQFGLRYTFN